MTGREKPLLLATLAILASALLGAGVALASQTGAHGAAPAAGEAARSIHAVIDEMGRRILVPEPAERIVSLAPNITEILYALGAEDRLLAVTSYSDYPPEARSKPRVGQPTSPSLEEVAVLRPDLVLATPTINRKQTVEALARLGIPVYVTDPRSVEGMLEAIQHVADLVGSGERGKELVTQLRARLANLKQRLAGRPPKRVLFVVWEEPLITTGPHTFLADALRWAGAQSVIETTQAWPHASLEEVVHLQPDYLIFATSHPESSQNDLPALRARRGWRDLKAVQEGRVVHISEAIDRPSPRLVDAIEQLARDLHPEAFTEKTENGKEKMETQPEGAERVDLPFAHEECRLCAH